MKRILFIVLSGLIFSCTSVAKDYQTKSSTMDRYNFTQNVPQTFLINKKGEVVFRHKGFTRAVAKAFDNPYKLENSEFHMSQFEKILGEPIAYSDTGYTLIEMVWDQNSECPPCDRQVKLNNAVIKSFEKKGIDIEKHTIQVEVISSYVKDW